MHFNFPAGDVSAKVRRPYMCNDSETLWSNAYSCPVFLMTSLIFCFCAKRMPAAISAAPVALME